MGVTGLWRLVEPTGKPVPVETLENKVLAVDISIWLHQVVKGYQDARGAPVPNAHLMGLFQRLCKLLYFRIKPVFVFDGAFPDLKKETIAKRQDNKSKYHSESERLKRELALLLSKKTAISSLLGKDLSPKKAPRPDPNPAHHDDLFKLPALPEQLEESESESDEDTSSGSIVDLHSVDLESDNFKKLEVKEKYELLIELKETRKMNSWGKLHELPKKSDNFSDFQVQRLLKRRKLQECLQETEKQMSSDGMSLNDLEVLLNEEGIDTKLDTIPTRRIASSDTTRFILINNVKQALAEARKKKLEAIKEENKPSTSKVKEESEPVIFANPKTPEQKKDELDEDLEKAIQMSLECADEPSTNIASEVNTSNISEAKTDESWSTFMTDSDSEQSEYGSDSEEKDGFEQPDMSTAKAYIMQYSDFTHGAIEDIVKKSNKGKTQKKTKHLKVDKILEDLSKEKSIIADEVELSSDDDSDIEEVQPNSSQDVPSATQTSVLCLGEMDNEIISLDTSFDDNLENTEESLSQNSNGSPKIPPTSNQLDEMSDSSDSDFEEVTDDNNSTNKPAIELTLELPKTAPKDDIFADVFEVNNSEPSKVNTESEIKVKLENIDDFDFLTVEKSDSNYIVSSNSTAREEETSIEKQIATNDTVNNNEENKEVNNLVKERPKCSDNKIAVVNASFLNIESVKSTLPTEINTTNNNTSTTHDKTTDSTANESQEKLTREKLNEIVENIQNEENNLIQEKGRLDRIGRNITEQMTKDAQELLQIFGIPYIVAPMEAEAQCAFLESVNLTDGTITDDSDIWLFGGRTVYKNFFNQKKHVLQFLSERIEKSLNLTREQLILLAMLVGSDYTTGLQGVGPVTALEILAAFPHKKKLSEESKQARYNSVVTGLQEFKRWVRAGKRTDSNSLKKKLKNVQVTDDFPSVRVVQAYLEPNVEKNEENFTWGELDITVLRDYTKSKFGWSQNKLDEIIKPVISRLQNRHAQKSLQDYFKRKIEFHSLEDQVSKRVKAAIQKMGPEGAKDVELSSETGKQPPKRKYTKNKTTLEKNTEASTSTDTENDTSNHKKPKLTLPQHNKQRLPLKLTKIQKDKPKLNPNLPKELSTAVAKVQKLKEEKSSKPIPMNLHKKDIIPQREKDKRGILENKFKAIELFRKTTIDTKVKAKKRKPNFPKDEANLSESDSE